MEDKIKIVGEIISERQISPKHLNITSRQVSYWKDKNILPFFDKSAHSKMNIPMATWMFIVRELSDLGVSSQKLASLAKEVWQTPRENNFLKVKIEKHLTSKAGKDLDQDTKNRLLSVVNDPRLLETLSQESNPFTDCLVDSVLIERNQASLYYFPKSQEHYISVLHVKETTKLLGLMETEPFICIPLTPFLETVVSMELNLVDKDLLYLSEVENQIRETVIFKAPKNVLITLNDKTLDLSLITEQHKRADELAAFFLNNKLPKNAELNIKPRSQGNYVLTIITK